MPKVQFAEPPKRGGEKWIALPVCGAWVSDLGRVWVALPWSRSAGLVRQTDRDGYMYVAIPGANNGKPIGVHRLVAHAFHGECPDGMCIDHIDCDPSNNRPGNVQYVTPSENTRLYWQRRKAMDPIEWKAERLIREARSQLRRSGEAIAEGRLQVARFQEVIDACNTEQAVRS